MTRQFGVRCSCICTVVDDDVEGHVGRCHLPAEAPPEVSAALVTQHDVHIRRSVKEFLYSRTVGALGEPLFITKSSSASEPCPSECNGADVADQPCTQGTGAPQVAIRCQQTAQHVCCVLCTADCSGVCTAEHKSVWLHLAVAVDVNAVVTQAAAKVALPQADGAARLRSQFKQ